MNAFTISQSIKGKKTCDTDRYTIIEELFCFILIQCLISARCKSCPECLVLELGKQNIMTIFLAMKQSVRKNFEVWADEVLELATCVVTSGTNLGSREDWLQLKALDTPTNRGACIITSSCHWKGVYSGEGRLDYCGARRVYHLAKKQRPSLSKGVI